MVGASRLPGVGNRESRIVVRDVASRDVGDGLGWWGRLDGRGFSTPDSRLSTLGAHGQRTRPGFRTLALN